LSTKIHATVDALGNPTGFHLTPGQAHDLEGADVLLQNPEGACVIADKAYDAQARVIAPLHKAGKAVVIPCLSTRRKQRSLERHLYKARHLIENFFARLKQYRAIATRDDKTARNFLGAIPGCLCGLAQLMTHPNRLLGRWQGGGYNFSCVNEYVDHIAGPKSSNSPKIIVSYLMLFF
jgi:transposase